MKNNFKLIIGFIVGILIGITSTYFTMNKNSVAEAKTISKTPAHSSLASSNKRIDPFVRMEEISKRFDDLIEKSFIKGHIPSSNSWPQEQLTGSTFDIKQSEDNKYLYYEISLKGIAKDNVKVEVVDDSLRIYGQVNKTDDYQNENGAGRSFVGQIFQKSLSLPLGIDSSKVLVESKHSSIVVKLPKTSV
jgi:HSP20 family molecular chaperone IbpA